MTLVTEDEGRVCNADPCRQGQAIRDTGRPLHVFLR